MFNVFFLMSLFQKKKIYKTLSEFNENSDKCDMVFVSKFKQIIFSKYGTNPEEVPRNREDAPEGIL